MQVSDTLLAGRYRLVERIASGGMGVVWRGTDELLERTVAVKQLRIQPAATDEEAELAKNRAMREARITARLHHPNAVPVFDAVEHDGQPCLIMRFLPSKPLSAVLRENGSLPPVDAARIGAQVASALAAAHRIGIVHRDVKPGNILIADEDGSAHISDFGISHALGDSTLTATGLVHGTPAYLAPEVARGGEASFAADVFSLGSTVYAMTEGAPPFGADNNSIAMLHRVALADFAPPRHSGVLKPLLRDMMALDPEARPTMAVVTARLAALHDATAGPDDETLTQPLLAAAEAATVASPVADAATLPAPTRQHAPTALLRPEAPRSAPVPVQPDGGSTEAAAPAAAAAGGAAAVGAAAVGAGAAAVAPAAALAPAVTPAAALTPPPTPAPTQSSAAIETPAPAAAPLDRSEPPRPIDPSPQPRAPRRRRRGLVALVSVLAALAVGVPTAAVLGSQAAPHTTHSRQPPAVAAEPAPASASAHPGSTPIASTPRPASSASAASSSPRPATSPSAAASAAAPSSPPSRRAVQAAPPADTSAAGLAQALISYYDLLPGDTADAWPRMTADYQRNTAGGRASYESFWNQVNRVTISEVQGEPPNRAVAVITYYRSGSVTVERTAFRFVQEGGRLKIAGSTVLSHSER